MSVWDAPNQQVVREDQSPPWEEGTGNGGAPDLPLADSGDDLDAMTKSDLLDYAAEHGVEADDSMTKAQIREAIGA